MVENQVTSGLHRLCLGVVEELGLVGAAITVMTPEGAEASVASSSDAVQAMRELEFAMGEGPSMDSFTSGRPVLVPDLAASDGRWVGFTPAALASGLSGVYAFPLGVGAVRPGVLTCYCEPGHRLDAENLRRCLMVADDATALLLSDDGSNGPVHADPAVRGSLHIRNEVYQAQGMLKVELGISLADAMARLRAIAYAEEADLNEVAADLVSGRRPFPRMGMEEEDEA